MSFASSRPILLHGLRAHGRLASSARFAVPAAVRRSGAPSLLVGPASARAFSWRPWSSSTSPADTLARPAEDGFAAEPAPVETLTPSEALSTSSSATENATASMSDALSSATSSLSDAGAAAADAVVSAVPPALPVDMATAGLTDWTPAGLVCSLFETIQTTTGYSWVPTLAIATVGIRVALLWPQIRSMRAAARIQPHQARIEQLQAESLAAARAKDMLRAQELSRERTEIYQRAGVRVSDMLLAPIAMLPAQLGLFFAAKRLAEMPWPSLASESWMWIPSLAAADPLWLLPVLNTVAIQMQLYISLQDAATEKAAHTVNALRAMSVAGVPVLLGFSSAVNLIVLFQSLFGVVQVAILRMSVVRRALGLPEIKPNFKIPGMRDSYSTFKTYLNEQKKQAEAGNRR